MGNFNRAISVSFIVHMTIFVLIIGGVFFIKNDQGGSGGSGGAVVTVWLAGPSGQIISGNKYSQRRGLLNKKRRSNNSMKENKTGKDMENTRKSSAATGRGKSAGTGSGIGSGAGKAVGTGKGEGVGTGSEGNALLTRIWKKINRAKYYPMMAKKQGLEGTPRVTFSIRKDGNIEWVRLKSSCGAEVLDQAALAAVKRAAPLPHFPGAITLQIRYSLSD